MLDSHNSREAAAVTVHVLTHCVDPTLAYGTLLVFGSIRTGFPTARIEVVDNGSCAAMVPRIRAAAESVGASFEARPLIHYVDHWHRNLFLRDWPEPTGPVAFVDPDMVFWRNCEGWDFGEALLAGHLHEAKQAGSSGVSARLHPSFLWVPSVARLRQALPDASIKYAGGWLERVAGRPLYHDTLAPLYAALAPRCALFGETELDSFDHLQYGSHLPAILGSLSQGKTLPPWLDAHLAAAKGDVARLRGLWRRREAAAADFAERRRAERFADTPPVRAQRTPTIRVLRDLQGIDATDEHLEAVELDLRMRLQRRKPVG